MKNILKYIFITCTLMCSVFTVSAFEAHRVTPVDVGSAAMGGTHLADTTHFYTLYSNPAAISFTEEKSLWLGPSLIVSGPIDEFPNLAKNIFNTDFEDSEQLSDNIITPVLGMLGTSGLNIRLDASLLTFGKIITTENFSYIITPMDNLFADISVQSLTNSSVSAGYDTGLEFAIALPINLNIPGTLSIGLAGRGTYQIEAELDNLLSNISNISLDILKYYTTAGIGIDAAIEHQAGIFTTAIVCQDIFSPAFITQHNDLDSIITFGGTKLDIQTLDTKLGIGTEIKIPLKQKIKGVVTACVFYIDYNNLIPLFQQTSISRNPILELSIGTEIQLIDVVTLQAGINEAYLSAGFGINLGHFKTNFAIYGSELGLEPGSNPQLNVALSTICTY